jgi:hypothetical protein
MYLRLKKIRMRAVTPTKLPMISNEPPAALFNEDGITNAAETAYKAATIAIDQ